MRLGALTSVYLDANAWIRIVEGDGIELGEFLFENAASDLLRLYTSELTLAEVLVVPLRAGNADLVLSYENALSSDGRFEVVPVDRTILRRSAEIRATIGNKGADSIHVATAVGCNCSVFISDDARIKLPSGIVRMTVAHAMDPSVWS